MNRRDLLRGIAAALDRLWLARNPRPPDPPAAAVPLRATVTGPDGTVLYVIDFQRQEP